MLTVVLSTFNEAKLPFFNKLLEVINQARKEVDIEIICIDKNSTDNTPNIAKSFGAQLIKTSANSRAERLNQGIKAAKGEIILLHHSRSILTKEGLIFLAQNKHHLQWGGFEHSFDKNSMLLKFTSWYSNNVRGKIRNILYLDHCIFFRKTLINKVGLIPAVDIFEDTLLSEALRRESHLHLLPYPSRTSAIRFEKNGEFKQAIMNQILKIGYLLKINHRLMNKIYEYGLNLNSKY